MKQDNRNKSVKQKKKNYQRRLIKLRLVFLYWGSANELVLKRILLYCLFSLFFQGIYIANTILIHRVKIILYNLSLRTLRLNSFMEP